MEVEAASRGILQETPQDQEIDMARTKKKAVEKQGTSKTS